MMDCTVSQARAYRREREELDFLPLSPQMGELYLKQGENGWQLTSVVSLKLYVGTERCALEKRSSAIPCLISFLPPLVADGREGRAAPATTRGGFN